MEAPLYIVDRITQGIATLEDDTRRMWQVPLHQLPSSLREGDCLRQQQSGWVRDEAETQRRREEAQARFQRLQGE